MTSVHPGRKVERVDYINGSWLVIARNSQVQRYILDLQTIHLVVWVLESKDRQLLVENILLLHK